MVTQDLAQVTPKILAQGLMSARELAIMPRIVNTSYGTEAAARGRTIDVPLPSAMTGGDVTAALTPPTPEGMAPTTTPITMNKWKHITFALSDREVLEAMNGLIPMQASAAIRWLVNQIDISILNEFQNVWQYVGHATYVGLNPDSSYTANSANVGVQKTKDATDLRLALNKGLAPFDNRHVVTTADVEANALQLRPFQDQSWSGSADALVNGQLNTKLGFRWFMDQNVPAFTTGTLTGTISVSGTAAIGATTVTVATDAAEAVVLNPGDLVKFANHTQVYVVTSAINIGASTSGSFSLQPPLTTAATGSTLTLPTNFANGNVYYNSLAFHSEALAFASRPFEPVPPGLGSFTDQASDPISGLSLRLEVRRAWKETLFTYDCLWGVRMIRPEWACRFITVS